MNKNFIALIPATAMVAAGSTLVKKVRRNNKKVPPHITIQANAMALKVVQARLQAGDYNYSIKAMMEDQEREIALHIDALMN